MQEFKEHFLALPTTQLGRKSTLLALVGLGSLSFAILANSAAVITPVLYLYNINCVP